MEQARKRILILGERPLPTIALPARTVHEQPTWKFLLWWVLANTAGAIVGASVAQATTGGLYGGSSDEGLLRFAATGLVMGVTIGFVEWLVLRTYAENMLRWVLATAVGWAAGFSASMTVQEGMLSQYPRYHTSVGDGIHDDFTAVVQEMLTSIGEVLSRFGLDALLRDLNAAGIVFAVVLGTFIGVAQAVVLKWRVARVELWVLANAFAWVLLVVAYPVLASAAQNLIPAYYHQELIGEFTLGMILELFWIFGILELTTGLMLLWLLRDRAKLAPEALSGSTRFPSTVDHRR